MQVVGFYILFCIIKYVSRIRLWKTNSTKTDGHLQYKKQNERISDMGKLKFIIFFYCQDRYLIPNPGIIFSAFYILAPFLYGLMPD